jgi:hypothetical protein
VTRAAGVYRNTCRNKGTRGNKVVKIKSRAESREQRSRGAEEQRSRGAEEQRSRGAESRGEGFMF